MIIYGYRTKVLGMKPVPTAPCSGCGQCKLQIVALQRYTHLYWIPFFPLPKQIALDCGHCQRFLMDKDLPVMPPAFMADMKREFRTPVWMFTWAFLFTVAAAIGLLSSQRAAGDELPATPPAIGDVFVFHVAAAAGKPSVFRAAKLVAIDDHQLSFVDSVYDYKRETAARERVADDTRTKADYFTGRTFETERDEEDPNLAFILHPM